MGTSSRGVIVWTSLQDVGPQTHGLSVVPGSHRHGLLPGKQTSVGYVLDETCLDDSLDLYVTAGQLVLMSPFLAHRTRFNPSSTEWKLSLSVRFDDLTCERWSDRGFVSAYKMTVDRSTYLT